MSIQGEKPLSERTDLLTQAAERVEALREWCATQGLSFLCGVGHVQPGNEIQIDVELCGSLEQLAVLSESLRDTVVHHIEEACEG